MLSEELDIEKAQREMGYSESLYDLIYPVFLALEKREDILPLARRFTSLVRQGLPEEELLAILTKEADIAKASLEVIKIETN